MGGPALWLFVNALMSLKNELSAYYPFRLDPAAPDAHLSNQ
jgi:hypothetical protein